MRITQYLESFDESDWKSFRNYIESRLKNRSDVKKITEFIFENRTKDLSTILDPSNVMEELTPLKSRKAVLNLYSEMVKEIKEFLIQDQLKSEYYEKSILLIKALNRRKLYKESNRLAGTTNKRLTLERLNWWNCLYQQRLNHEHYFSDNPVKYSAQGHKILSNAINSIDQYHEQLRGLYQFETENMSMLNINGYDQIQSQFLIEDSSENEILSILFHLICVRKQITDDSAEILLNKLSNNYKNYSQSLLLIIYLVLRMHFARKANMGDRKMINRVFELNKQAIENGYFEFNKQIDIARFLSVIELSSFLGQIKWGQKFLHEYKDRLAITDRKFGEAVAHCLLLFGQERYEEALIKINQIFPKDLRFKNYIQRLSLITEFELNQGNYYYLKQKISNYKLFYYRNKRYLSKRITEASLNLSSIIQSIHKNANPVDIEDQLKSMTFVFYRIYLFKKLDQMKKA